jgi:Glutamyl- and glutaminyl-tRNA synthetases
MDRFQRFRRTRIAPTPSGYLHLGNAYSFALTAAIARRTGARILLRIDDLDRQRIKREYVEDVFDTLDYLELPWDEGPRSYVEYEATYSQAHRLPLYHAALKQLREGSQVFACNCSRTMLLDNNSQGMYSGNCRDRGLPLGPAGCSWRLRTDMARKLVIRTLDAGERSELLPAVMRDFVVRKKDGFPAYQLASLVDDVHFDVDFVIRGEDLWASSLAQLYLADVLGYEAFLKTTFHHHGLLKAPSQEKKLSKSAGATSIQYLRRQGHTKADIFRLISQMIGLGYTVSCWEELGHATLA